MTDPCPAGSPVSTSALPILHWQAAIRAAPAGSASSSIAMPSSLALMGSTIFSQALSFDPNLNPLWLAASNAHKGTLGN